MKRHEKIVGISLEGCKIITEINESTTNADAYTF